MLNHTELSEWRLDMTGAFTVGGTCYLPEAVLKIHISMTEDRQPNAREGWFASIW